MTKVKRKKETVTDTTIRRDQKVTLKLKLTPDERAAKAERIATLSAQVDAAEAVLKEHTSAEKAKIKPLKSQLKASVIAHRDGEEERSVTAIRVFDATLKEKWLEYQGEVFQREPMDAYELAQARERGVFGDHPGLASKEDEPAADEAAPADERAEIRDVMREETGRKTKKDVVGRTTRRGKDAAAEQGQVEESEEVF